MYPLICSCNPFILLLTCIGGHSTESDSVKSEGEANKVDVLNTLDTGPTPLDEILSVEAEKVDKGRDGGGRQQKEVK